MKGKNQLILAVCIFAACLFILAASMTAKGELTNLHLNMKAGDELVPETKGDPEADPEIQRVEADYDQLPSARINRDWVDVGTWTSDQVNSDFTIDGRVEFNIWFKVCESAYNADPDWEFYLYHNNVEIIFASIDQSDESMEEPIEVTAGNTTDDPVDILEGDTLSVYIRYRAWEDCDIYFDCARYDSGVQVESDFLELFELAAENEEVRVEVYDPFGTDWNEGKTYLVLKVDGEDADFENIRTESGGEHDIHGKTVTGTFVCWDLTDGFSGGEEVKVWVKYTICGEPENRGLKDQCEADSQEKKRPVARIRSISPDPVEEEDEVTLDGRDSYDEDGTIQKYVWKSNIDGEVYNGSIRSIKTSSLSVGNHSISLVVRDDDGLWSKEVTGSLEVTERPNTSPEITLLYPGDGVVILDPLGAGELEVGWEGYDADGDDLTYTVQTGNTSDVLRGGVSGEETFTMLIYVAEYDKETTFYWRVLVSDGRTEVESEVWSFVVRVGQVEILQIEGPEDGRVLAGTVKISGHAGVGEDYIWDGEVKYVEISIDDGMWFQAAGTENWSYMWDTIAVGNGLCTISARAFDGVYYSKTMTIQVYVNNDPGGGDGAGSDDDDDFEIAGMNGFFVIGAVAACVIVVVIGLISRQRNYDWEDDDEEGYEEDYDGYYGSFEEDDDDDEYL